MEYKVLNARFRLFIMEQKDKAKSLTVNLTGNQIKPINIYDEKCLYNTDKTKILAIQDIIRQYFKYVYDKHDIHYYINSF